MENLPLSSVLVKAMDNAQEGITISDFKTPDNPLIYVNKGFLNMVGYSMEECIGKNCRYLQGPATSREQVKNIREAIANKQPIKTELLNYHKNGRPFWNSLSLTPIFNDQGELTHYIGVQNDITLKKELKEQAEELERHKLISQATVRAQEAERYEIGKELHDNVTQMIATLRLYLNIAKSQTDQSEEMLLSSIDLTNDLLQEVRRVSHRLAGPAFDTVPFSQAIEALVHSIEIAVPFNIHLYQSERIDKMLNDNQKLVLYRILQEQMNNIVKYAKANEVNITLLTNSNNVDLTITDDGIGFDVSKTSHGIGLRNISNRLLTESGKFDLKTSPGEGCTLHASLPVKAFSLASIN